MKNNFLIHKTLSPLDKLTNQLNNQNQLSIDTLTQNSNKKLNLNSDQNDSSFSLTPSALNTNFPSRINPLQSNPQSNHSTSEIHLLNHENIQSKSALSLLTNSLHQVNHSDTSARPSTGRVNSSTATTQTPRELISSYYGDQHSILSLDSIQLNDQHQQQSLDHSNQEVLNSPKSHHHHHHLTQNWFRSPPSETETETETELDSEFDTKSNFYHSGLSLASQDPFQYRNYETSPQSHQSFQNFESNASPSNQISNSIEPVRNFSRPLARNSNPLLASSTDLNPNHDKSHRESESQYSSSNYDEPNQINHKLNLTQNSNQIQLENLRCHSPSSILTRSSMDTSSSKDSNQLKPNSKLPQQHHPTNKNQLKSSPLRSHFNPSPKNNLPEIVFSQSDHLESSTTPHVASDLYSNNMLNHSTSHQNELNRQTSRDSYPSSHQDKLLEAPHHKNNRLSIYSLPSSDDLTPAELNLKQRYTSRSPITFDGSDSSRVPSPINPNDSCQHQPIRPPSHIRFSTSNGLQLHSAIQKAKATLAVNNHHQSHKPPSQIRTAQDYLQAGIDAHESGDLERSAGLFERAAREGGGCGAGMLMWGLSLRHGWGCQVNEVRAFKWLQKAAESVIEDLDPNSKHKSHGSISPNPSTSASTSNSTFKEIKPSSTPGEQDQVAKSELVLAIYELGQCFMRGWGCKKDKQLAISYFQLAAKLGDPDAQQELGFCYTNGKGTKKDLKLAAKYYRMAASQGVEMMGSQWIWKDKYN